MGLKFYQGEKAVKVTCDEPNCPIWDTRSLDYFKKHGWSFDQEMDLTKAKAFCPKHTSLRVFDAYEGPKEDHTNDGEANRSEGSSPQPADG